MDPKDFLQTEMPARFEHAMKRLEQRIRELEAQATQGDQSAAAKRDKYQRRLEDARKADVSFQVELIGDGGGTFTLSIRDGRMTAQSGPAEQPLVSLRQSVSDFLATVEQGLGARFSLFGGPSAADEARGGGSGFARLLAPSVAQQLRQVRVTLRFTIGDRPGAGDWSLDLGIGGEPEQPSSTIVVPYTEYEEIAAGRLLPQAAFMAGKIRVQGDFGALMRLAPILMAG